MIDTHTHPYLEQFEEGGYGVVQAALDAGVSHMVLPNVDASTISPMIALHRRFPENTSIALGLHPTEVGADWEQVLAPIEELLRKTLVDSDGIRAVAVGEVGIDLYWDKSYREQQLLAFARQLRLAMQLRLPVIIHCREALDDTLDVIREVKPDIPLVFHCFTSGPEAVRKIREVCDPMFGINGVVTYKNAQDLRDALPVIGLDRILLETDAPYLAPVPKRGRRNEPSYVHWVCGKVAETLGLSPETVEEATDNNARRFFSL